MLMRIDVFYKSTSSSVASAPTLDLFRSWDGTIYGEVNGLELSGPDRLVFFGDRIRPAWVADDKGKVHMMCSSARIPK
jgi:hypothetical protein